MNFVFDGRHLVVDAIVEEPSMLNNSILGVELLETIVERIDMTMIIPPVVVKFPQQVSELHRTLKRLEEEGLADSKTAQQIRQDLYLRKVEAYGYSSYVMIAESHISLHTFPELGFFSFDCYSCKYFDTNLVEEILNDFFKIVKSNSQVFIRHIPSVGGDQ